MKPVNPCTQLLFKVNLNIPSGYVICSKYEWFINDVSVKTTTDPADPVLLWTVSSKTINAYCKVTYQKQDGTVTSPSASNTFTPIIKILDFESISTITSPPNYGCSTNTVSYSLIENPCTGSGFPCNQRFNVLGNYNITWQAPAGWIQTSLTNKGSNVSFIPDGTSAGTLTATIHIPGCTYTETRTFTIIRGAEVPTFATSDITIHACSPSSTVSINPTCGALDYTYSVVGNPGITFSNSQQVFTTASTSVSINIPTGSSVNTLKARANYPNATSSTDASIPLYAGPQTPTFINGFYENGKKFAPNTQYSFASTGTDWIVGGGTILTGQGTKIITVLTAPRPSGMPDLSFYMSVRENGACGPSDYFSRSGWIVAGGSGGAQIITFPNPANGSINVSLVSTNSSVEKTKSQPIIYKVRIADFMGNTKKVLDFQHGITSTNISLAGIKSGTYTLSVFDGSLWSSQQIVVQ